MNIFRYRERRVNPREITIETLSDRKKEVAQLNPWVRCVARGFDYALFLLFLLGVHRSMHWSLPSLPFFSFIPLEFALWIPCEAALLATWGTTPGKWLLQIQLRRYGMHLDFHTALKRSLSVWIRGLGMGIWGLNLLCLLIAYQQLRVRQVTTWDREDQILVMHSVAARWRLPFAVLVSLTGFLLYYSLIPTGSHAHV